MVNWGIFKLYRELCRKLCRIVLVIVIAAWSDGLRILTTNGREEGETAPQGSYFSCLFVFIRVISG